MRKVSPGFFFDRYIGSLQENKTVGIQRHRLLWHIKPHRFVFMNPPIHCQLNRLENKKKVCPHKKYGD